MKNKINIRKITLTGIFIAISVVGSLFSFPVLGSIKIATGAEISMFSSLTE